MTLNKTILDPQDAVRAVPVSELSLESSNFLLAKMTQTTPPCSNPTAPHQQRTARRAPISRMSWARKNVMLAKVACPLADAVLIAEVLEGSTKRKCSHLDNNDSNCSRKRPRTLSTEKAVRFRSDSDGLVTFVTPRCATQKEHLRDIWCSRNDYKSFREDIRGLALAFELGVLHHIDAEDCCLRGLEANLHRSIMNNRRSSRRNMIDVVLHTQIAQKDNGMRDPEMLRGLSVMLSKNACEDALKLASYDVEEADAVMNEGDAVQITI